MPKHWPLENNQPLPLLLDFHGWTQHAGFIELKKKKAERVDLEFPAGHEKDGHNFFAVADEDEFGGFLVLSPEGMADVGERE